MIAYRGIQLIEVVGQDHCAVVRVPLAALWPVNIGRHPAERVPHLVDENIALTAFVAVAAESGERDPHRGVVEVAGRSAPDVAGGT